MKPFRFGAAEDAETPGEVVANAQAAEAAGFDVISTFDHLLTGPGAWSPLAPLVAMAAATTTLRIGTLVLNNDFHHPVHLAREIASIDQLSRGRVELGIGAGHSFPEYEKTGQPFDPPAVRKARMAEAIEILRGLLDGDEVTFHGEHYRIEGAQIQPTVQERVPILVGVNGSAALAHAARHADIVAPTMLGKTLEDGHRHTARWEADRIDRTIDHIRESAGDRWGDIELNALVQNVTITDDAEAVAAGLAGRIPGLTVEDALAAPFLALGTHQEIADHLWRCRERWGFSYYCVRSIEDFAPVIEILRERDTG